MGTQTDRTFLVTGVEVDHQSIRLMMGLASPRKERMLQRFRKKLQSILEPGPIPELHITLAYRRKEAKGGYKHIRDALESVMLGQEVTLGPTYVSKFSDLTLFPEWDPGL